MGWQVSSRCRRRIAAVAACVVLAGGLGAGARAVASQGPTAQGGMAGLAPGPSPAVVARGHLAQATKHLQASCEMLKKGDRHAVDGYYIACQEAWNAVWTCPESRDVVIEASDRYADALAGLLEAARAHGRLGAGGLWVG
ncbi:MAG: hypothetical protein ACKOC8_10855, partial [Pirellulales bacterium]